MLSVLWKYGNLGISRHWYTTKEEIMLCVKSMKVHRLMCCEEVQTKCTLIMLVENQ